MSTVKTRYKLKVVILIEGYGEWRRGFSSLFNLEKSPVPSLCYFCNLWGVSPWTMCCEHTTTARMLYSATIYLHLQHTNLK